MAAKKKQQQKANHPTAEEKKTPAAGSLSVYLLNSNFKAICDA